ncbi:MAG: hypothetical protein AB7O66_13835 [Limisphaerales bacterium]
MSEPAPFSHPANALSAMKKQATIAALLGIIMLCLGVVYRYVFHEIDDGYVTPRERAIIKEFDADHDGKLNAAERRTADTALQDRARRRQEERVRQMDRNGDGKVSADEEATARAEAAERKKEWIQRHDMDGDGRLSATEAEAAARAGRSDLLRRVESVGDGTPPKGANE